MMKMASVAESGGTASPKSDGLCKSEVRRLRAAAFEVVAATEQKPDGSWVIGWDGEVLIAALAEAVGPMRCEGCGCTKGIAEIRSDGFVSCCPERSMRPPAESGASSPSEASAGNPVADEPPSTPSAEGGVL